MGRMHNNGKGVSRRSLPYVRSAPAWSKAESKAVKEEIFKLVCSPIIAFTPPLLPLSFVPNSPIPRSSRLFHRPNSLHQPSSPRLPPNNHSTTAPQQQARKGFFPSQIGLVLRDSQAVAQVQAVTGSKILRILKAGGLGPRLPEDLYHMIKKAVTIRKHLSLYRKDKDAKFRLILVESRIHRLARYYRSKRQLPPNWRYDSSNASTLVA